MSDTPAPPESPYRIIVSHRVGEEFQVSIDCRSTTQEAAKQDLDAFLSQLAAYRAEENRKILDIHEQRATAIQRRIEEAGTQCRVLESERDDLIAEVASLKGKKDRRLRSA